MLVADALENRPLQSERLWLDEHVPVRALLTPSQHGTEATSRRAPWRRHARSPPGLVVGCGRTGIEAEAIEREQPIGGAEGAQIQVSENHVVQVQGVVR